MLGAPEKSSKTKTQKSPLNIAAETDGHMGLGTMGAGDRHESQRDREEVYGEARKGDPLGRGQSSAHRLETFSYQKVLGTFW